MELEEVVCWWSGKSYQVYMAFEVQRCITVPCHLELGWSEALEEIFCRRYVA